MRGRAVQLALARRAQFRMCLWLVHWLLRPKGRGRDHTYSIYDYVRMHVRATTAPTAPAAAISHVRISKINAQWRSLPTRRLGLQSIYTVHAVPVRTWYKYGIYAQSTQYTATRRIKSDYTRSAMWPSVAGESCESREAWAASLTTSCHLCLPVSRLHLPTGMRNSKPQPPSSRAPSTPTTSPRPGPQMAQIALRGAARREPAVHAWRARVAW